MEGDDRIEPVSEAIDQALLKILRPDLLEQYQKEKLRHREELRAIDVAMKRARQLLKRLFGPVRERKEAELEAEYLERTQGEVDRHTAWLAELKETVRDHWSAEPPAC